MVMAIASFVVVSVQYEPVSELPININSCGQMTPLGQCGSTAVFEGLAGVEMTVENEMIVDLSMDGSELLQGLHVPQFRHRAFSSPERLV